MRSSLPILALAISAAAHALSASEAPKLYYYNVMVNVPPPKGDPNFYTKRLAAYLKAKKLTGACVDLRPGTPSPGDAARPDQGASLLMSQALDKWGLIHAAEALCRGIPNCRYTTLVDQTVENLQAEIEFNSEGPFKGTYSQFNVMQKVSNLGTSCTSGDAKDSLNHAFDVKKALVQKMESSAGVPIELDFPVDITKFDGVKIRGHVGKVDFVYPARQSQQVMPAQEAGAPDAGPGHGANLAPGSASGAEYHNPYGS